MIPKVTIDAGHGGHDSGAVNSSTRLTEKSVVLTVAMMMAQMLKAQGVEPHLTRSSDHFVSLSDRAKLANANGSHLFLSLHCNSAASVDAHGYEVWTSPGDTGAAEEYATRLYDAFAKEWPERRGRSDMSDGDPDKESAFAVLRLTWMPAALFELEFIHNRPGSAFLNDEGSLLRCARALTAATVEQLKAMSLLSKGTDAEDAAQPIPFPVPPSEEDEEPRPITTLVCELSDILAALGASLARFQAALPPDAIDRAKCKENSTRGPGG